MQNVNESIIDGDGLVKLDNDMDMYKLNASLHSIYKLIVSIHVYKYILSNFHLLQT